MSSGSGNSPALRLVVIDDDPKNLKFVNFILARTGLEILSASDPEAGMDLIRRLRPQIVLMDLVMPGVQGMELLQKIVEFDPGIDVILMTGYYSTESAVEAIQKGAADYFRKPFSPEKLRQRIALIVEDAKRRQRSSKLENELLENFQFEGIIGRSPLMLDLFSKIRRIAPQFRGVQEMAGQGKFREDLYYRLCAVELKLPSLAQRPEDLLLLERHFLKTFSAQYKKHVAGLTRRAQTLLARYPWPGNIRELQNVLEHACMMAESDVIDVRDLPERVQNHGPSGNADYEVLMSIEQLERRHAQRVLDHVGGNKVRAAALLGVRRQHPCRALKAAIAQ